MRDLLLQRFVQARVLDSDADVAGEGLQQLNVFAGEEIAIFGFAQPKHCNRAVLHRARDVVIQIQCGNRALRGWRFAHSLVRVVEEQVPGSILGAVDAQELEIEIINFRNASASG